MRGCADDVQGLPSGSRQHLLREMLALLPCFGQRFGQRKEGATMTRQQYYQLAKILSTIVDPAEREYIGRAVADLCREIKPVYDANGNARLNRQHFMADVTGVIDLKRA